jgi:ketosteroid isomerase-like protein
VWHNFDNTVQSKADNLKTLEGLTKAVERIRYEVIERHQVGDRVIQRHNLHCGTRDGKELTIPAAIFITVKNERIVRIDEYLDTAQANALRAATGREKI